MVELGKLAVNPALAVKKPKVSNDRVCFLEPNQMTNRMASPPDWMRPIVTFARFTGARRGEVLKLKWEDVDFKRGLLTFRDAKNGTTDTVEMNQTTRALLESLPKPINPSLKV